MTQELTHDQTVQVAGDACCGTSRRALLRAAGAGGAVAAVGLTAAACGSSSNGTVSNPATAAATGAATGGSGGGAGAVLANVADVPVNGGKIIDGVRVVVTQPTAGTYKAFSAICTHAGCTVGSVANNQITCPCHGSVYSAVDGTVIQGPAPKALSAVAITVANGKVATA
jgi:Rieske Fe-S protein